MRKRFLNTSLFAILFMGALTACEKEIVQTQEQEVNTTIDDSRMQRIEEVRLHLESFAAEEDIELAKRELILKYSQISDRSTCFEDAWNYGTTEAEWAHNNLDFGYGFITLEFLQWEFTDQYYEAHCG